MLKYFSVDSTKITCWINSRGFGDHEKSMLFIHGSGGEHSLWTFQYARLNKNFNIIAVDLPGHGSSEGSGESDVNVYGPWVKRLLDVLQLKNVIIAGHSLGAAIALTFAADFGSMINGVVSVGGGLKMPVNPAIFELLKRTRKPPLNSCASFLWRRKTE